MDDIVDSPKSFIDACIHLKHCGAAKTVILGCHGVLSGNAVSLIQESNDVDEIIVTNTYPMALDVRNLGSKLRVIDVSGVLAEAIRRTHNGESISYLFHTAI